MNITRAIRCIFCVPVLVLITASSATAQAFRIEFEDLGAVVDDAGTIAVAINDRGDVVGEAEVDELGGAAYIWTRREGFRIISGQAAAYDINNHRDVVGIRGICPDDGGPCLRHGFVWNERRGLKDLGTFVPFAINDSGDMSGVCDLDEPSMRACVRRRGVVSDVPNGFSAPGINDRGEVVGGAGFGVPPSVAYVWSRSRGMTLLDAQGTVANAAADINNRGLIVGTGTSQGTDGSLEVATVWKKNGDLLHTAGPGTLGAGINDRGLVVGSRIAEQFQLHAFVWDPARGAPVDLQAPGALESSAYDINRRGEAVGWVRTASGHHAVIWRVRTRR